jgi:glycosyltransferase involved in cell wall biosynthesis
MPNIEWRMAILADGPRHDDVAALFGNVPHHRWRIWRDAGGADRASTLTAADMYVFPSYGGAGVDQVLGAQAAGLAVVANAAPGVEERIRDGVTGRVALEGNQMSFMNCVSFLLRHPDFRVSFGKAAASTVSDVHDIRAARHVLTGVLTTLGVL